MINLAVNPKDVPGIDVQDDIIAPVPNEWDPRIHGYPHVSVNAPWFDGHAGNLTIDGNPQTYWRPAAGVRGPYQLRLDFGAPRSFSAVRLLTLLEPVKSHVPARFALDASNDEFTHDVRPVFQTDDGAAHWSTAEQLRDIPVGAVTAQFLRVTLWPPADPAGFPAVTAVEIYGAPAAPPPADAPGMPVKQYANPLNLAFNPQDAPDKEWQAEAHGYPHATASTYYQGRPTGHSYPPCTLIDGDYRACRSWTVLFNDEYPHWVKIDFGRPKTMRYVKVFSLTWGAGAWSHERGERAGMFLPSNVAVEVSDDDFKADVRPVFAADSRTAVEKVWNWRRHQGDRFIDFGREVSARYVRLTIKAGTPHRTWIEELEVYQQLPPAAPMPVVWDYPDLGGVVAGAPVLLRDPRFLVWRDIATRKVFETDVPGGPDADGLEIFCARNEQEYAQLVVRPAAGNSLADVTLEFGGLTGENGAVLSRDCLRYYNVEYVSVMAPSAVIVEEKGRYSRGRAGRWPDPLPPGRPFTADEPRNYPLWLEVTVPENTPPGLYRGDIAILTQGQPAGRIPLRLRVWNFTLPPPARQHLLAGGDPSFRAVFPGYDASNYAGRPPDEIIRAMYRLLAQHRFNAGWNSFFPDSHMPQVVITNDAVAVDSAVFEALCAYLIEELGFAMLPLPLGPGAALGHRGIMGSRKGFDWNGLAYMSDAYQRRLLGPDGYLAQLAARLRARGWLEKFYLEVWHEPSDKTDPNGWSEALRLARAIRAIIPDLRLCVGGGSLDLNTAPELEDVIGHFFVYTSLATDEHLRGLIRRGTLVTTCYNGFWLTDFPAINCRILGWGLWRNGLQGFLHCGMVSGMVDPWEDAATRAYSPSQRRNGDNAFIYPMRDEQAPQAYWVSSIRMKLERKAIEDYEYLWLLREQVRAAAARGASLTAAEKLLAEAGALAPRFGKTAQLPYKLEFDPDPRRLEALRQAIGMELDRLAGPAK